MRGEKTRQLILNAAEELFGNAHYDSISLRDIAQKADVLLGLVTYHFKSKDRLFEEVVARRAQESNRVRLAELRKYDKPTIEQILDAFIRPLLEMHQRTEWHNYSRLTHQVHHQERWQDLNKRMFHATAREFFEALIEAMPGSSPEVISRGFVYAVFVMLGVTHEGYRVSDLTERPVPKDLEQDYYTVLPFVAGGLRALALSEFRPVTGPLGREARAPEEAPRTKPTKGQTPAPPPKAKAKPKTKPKPKPAG